MLGNKRRAPLSLLGQAASPLAVALVEGGDRCSGAEPQYMPQPMRLCGIERDDRMLHQFLRDVETGRGAVAQLIFSIVTPGLSRPGRKHKITA